MYPCNLWKAFTEFMNVAMFTTWSCHQKRKTYSLIALLSCACRVLAGTTACSTNPCASVPYANGQCSAQPLPSTTYTCGCNAGYTWSSNSQTCLALGEWLSCGVAEKATRSFKGSGFQRQRLPSCSPITFLPSMATYALTMHHIIPRARPE